jgi:DNA-binding winged helix-turn-helix (wHTH) protein/predicted ATPase
MKAQQTVRFGPFRLDAANAHLWRETEKIPLKPKTFSVLCYLIERAGQLVTKEELFRTLWSDVRVGDAVLKVCIREIREALADHAKTPQFIETVHRRGYRFIGEVVSSLQSVVSSSPLPTQSSVLSPQHFALVGRDVELSYLHNLLSIAQTGKRQLVFVTGEAGIGKSALVEAFLLGLRIEERGSSAALPQRPNPNSRIPNPHLCIARGHCLAQFGEGEPYMPVLEALGQLCRTPDLGHIVDMLSHNAPTWLAQMPGVLTNETLEALRPRVLGTTRERMLRELAEALEALTVEQTLVLHFEDLHWSDAATLDFISYVARRPHPARLLIIGTYRPSDVERHNHPLKLLKQDLHVHRYCEELAIGPLSRAAVGEYVAAHHAVPVPTTQPGFQQLTQMIHQRTEGNPLFMVGLVDYIISREVINDQYEDWNVQHALHYLDVPVSLRAFIEHQIDQVSEHAQQVLQTASLIGREFSAAAVAAGTEESIDTVETICEELARQSLFLQRKGTEEWPDGTIAARYRFLHVLHQNVLAERPTARQRISQHQRIGERLEAAYGNRAREIAAELALRFEEGRDYQRALQHRWQAGKNATRRHAHQEAITHFTKALALLTHLPETQERKQQELGLRIILGGSLVTAKGHAAPEVEAVYAEARMLCQEIGTTPQLFPALAGLYRHYTVRGKFDIARELANQLLQLAHAAQEPTLLMGAHGMLGYVLFLLGEFVTAQEHLEQSIALYDVQRHRTIALLYGDDPGVASLAFAAWTLWFRGYPDQALQRNNAALLLAHEVSHPHVHTTALALTAQFHRFQREEPTVRERVEDVLVLAREYGFPLWTAVGTFFSGWTLTERGQVEAGIAQIHEGLVALRAVGSESERTQYLGVLAEAYGKAEQPQEGLGLIEEALTLVNNTGERFWEAELYRVKGQLTLQQLSVVSCQLSVPSTQPLTSSTQAEAEAEACFLKAIATAQQQHAKSLELRAVMSLVRLRQYQAQQHVLRNMPHETRPKFNEAHQMLVKVYNWFSEGFDTADLQEARALLDELIAEVRK